MYNLFNLTSELQVKLLKWDCMKYLSIVSVLPTVDIGWHDPSLKKQARV